MFHAPVICHRLFFAVRPPIDLARQVTNAAHWFGDGGTMLRPEHLHVTLDILDDIAAFDPALVQRLIGVGDAVAARPFRIVLDRVSGSTRSIALRPGHRASGLESLHQEIVERRGGTGVAGRAGYRFSAHMTLGYRGGVPFSEAVTPVAWDAEDFVLIHSHVGRARHDVLGRWTLGDVDSRQLRLF